MCCINASTSFDVHYSQSPQVWGHLQHLCVQAAITFGIEKQANAPIAWHVACQRAQHSAGAGVQLWLLRTACHNGHQRMAQALPTIHDSRSPAVRQQAHLHSYNTSWLTSHCLAVAAGTPRDTQVCIHLDVCGSNPRQVLFVQVLDACGVPQQKHASAA